MKVRDFINKVQLIPESYWDKEIVIFAPNGLEMPPLIKKQLKDKYDALNFSPENVDKFVITDD